MDKQKEFGCAVILCGGRSLRMGFDKCKINIGGKPIYELIAEKLEIVFDEIILVTSDLDRILGGKYRVVEDIIKECGPIGGIYTGLKYASSNYVFFTACDMPFVDIQLIENIINILKNNSSYNGAVAVNRGYIEPLHSFYSKALISSIKSNIDKGNYQISKLVESSDIYRIAENYWNKDENPNIFSNLNHKKDLDILIEIYGDEVAYNE
jgi:molybdenum cofactor guanylyltransferase